MKPKISIIYALFIILFLASQVFAINPNKNESELKSSELKKVNFHSKILKKDMKINIFLPKGYNNTTVYPVLYIIHGGDGGNENSWMPQRHLDSKADYLIKKGKIKPLIIVAPQLDNSWGVNSASETKTIVFHPDAILDQGMYEDYLYKEIVSYIDSNYKTISSREGRYIGGCSMGGYIALHIAFFHDDMFSKVGGHSPAIFINQYPDVLDKFLYPAEKLRETQDPIYIAQRKDLRSLKVYLDCGNKDETKSYEGCEKLFEILQENKVDSEYHLNPGKHNSTYWETNIEKYLMFYAGY